MSPALPTDTGCGFDSCCRARPSVASTMPADDQIDVCTNAQIEITTNQMMDGSSITGNIIVVGEYSTPCPNGTVYLTSNLDFQKKDRFSQKMKLAWYSVKRFFGKTFTSKALASDPPLVFMNYCAITGNTGFEHIDPEDESQPTIFKFQPLSLLDANRKYFVILKGDEAMDNTSGVKSSWGIGMNTPTGAIAGVRTDNSSSFNGIRYTGAFIWSFRTRPDQGGNKGVCDIDHVTISPNSYLFNKLKQDLNENDADPANKNFDVARDIDKKFTARALSSRGEVLSPAPGYAWVWNWNIVDPAVVSFFAPAPYAANNAEQLIAARDNITDRKTDITATVSLTDTALSSVGNGESGTSNVYVFMCANPWPGFVAGTWRPWQDSIDAMDPFCVSGTCMDMGYELYYCRDSGDEGTADDLPSISSGTTRGSGVSSDVLKESYFFRPLPPVIKGVDLEVSPVPRGGEVELDWDEVVDPSGAQTVSKYNVYYGQKSGAPYPLFFSVDAGMAPYVAANPPVLVTGLNKTKDYYFAITAVYENGEESEYSDEVKIKPSDLIPPARPIGVIAEASRVNVFVNTAVEASDWSASNPERVVARISFGSSPNELLKHLRTFDLRWGTVLGDYPNMVSVPARDALVNGSTAEVVGDFAPNTPYYFIVSATRLDNSYSEVSGAVKVFFYDSGAPTAVSNAEEKETDGINIAIPSGMVNVSWIPNIDDAVGYNMYWGANHASYGNKVEITGRDADSGKTEKWSSFTYNNTAGRFFIAVSAVDASGNEGPLSDEIIVIPSQSSYTFRNTLTNVDFESGSIGGVPSDWSRSVQARSSIGISNTFSFSGNQSLRLYQAPSIPYPGVCGSDVASRIGPAYDAYPYSGNLTYSGSACTFSTSLDCNSGGVCSVPAGNDLPWPYSNRVMWQALSYNVSNLPWEVGEDYLVAFYYKGRLAASTRPILSFDLGWSSQCRNVISGSCASWGSPWFICPDDSSKCCRYPLQRRCYSSLAMPVIPAGDYTSGPYDGWNLYFDTFTYTSDLAEIYDNANHLRNQIGLSIGYNNTGAGTDFYVDDFVVAKKVKK
jgi:hypothetical protein